MGEKYPWVTCKDPGEGMFCDICQKLGNRGAWPTRGLADAIKLLRQHANSKWYIHDDAANATMTKQAERMQSVL